MVCNLCGTNEASIHLTEIVNDQMVEIHLCETCAQEKGTQFKTHFNPGELLSDLTHLAKEMSGMGAGPAEKTALKCPNCGLYYEEFGRTGRLGCAECYESFSKLLLPLIKRVQHSVQHVGKRPAQAPPSTSPVRLTHDLKELQNRLRKSVQEEAFEEAARIRDQIKHLEEKLKKGKRKPSR
ncbi:MAG: UvrB/UvrC motif-containing protein [Candidatus Omnitrophica bacterium]|nr:UvrB/UvrC motif-containing protein [Candidatus Omnitrophota bacterium]